jgi:lipopolysaccharide transport system permease protein
VGLLPWTFFANALNFAIPSLVTNMNLVSKIYFPREILPISSIFVCLIDFLIASLVFVGMMLWYQQPIGATVLLVPLVLLIQLILTIAVSLFASALNVFYRDIRFILPLVLQIWMYLCPIIYPVNMVPEWAKMWYLVNPMAVIIDSYRRLILIQQLPDWSALGMAAFISTLLLLLAYLYFKRAERQFADLI